MFFLWNFQSLFLDFKFINPVYVLSKSIHSVFIKVYNSCLFEDLGFHNQAFIKRLFLFPDNLLKSWDYNPIIKVGLFWFISKNLEFIERRFGKVLIIKNYQKRVFIRWRAIDLTKLIWLHYESNTSRPY